MMAVDSRATDMAEAIDKVVSVLDNTTKKGDSTDAFRKLHAIHTFLSSQAPTAPEAELLASRLLPALVAVMDRHAFYQPCAADDTDSEDTDAEEAQLQEHKQFIHSLLVTDAVAAVINTILRPRLSELLHALALGQAAAAAQSDASSDWNPAVGVLLGGSLPQPARYRHWIRAVARIAITPGDVAVHKSTSYPGSLIRGRDGKLLFWDPQHLPSTPGAATMLAVGSICLLQAATGRSCLAGELLPWDFCGRDDHGAAAKLVLLLSKDAPMLDLPDGALSHVLFSQLLESRGRICECLLNSPAALKALTQPLMHLAADPISWQQGSYAYHVQVLGYLCQWAASTLGLAGVQLLARTFMGPASGALSSLLEMPPAERPGATCLVRSCLLLLTHLACTSFGHRIIKTQGLMSRWLAAAPRWRQQLPVLQHLALLARAPLVDYQQELYFSPLFENERWQFRRVDTGTGAALPDQAAGTSVQVLDCVTAILRGPADTATKAILVDVLSRVAKAKGMPYFPAVDTLLDTASPSHAARVGVVLDSNAALNELDMYLASAGVSWEGCQQQALALILRCLQQKTVTVQLSGPGSGGGWAKDVKQILLACFQQPSAGDFLRKEDPVSRLQLLHNLEVFLKAEILPLTLENKHVLIHSCGTMLHDIRTAEEASILLHLLYHMLVCGECSNATLMHLSGVLAEPAALDAVLAFVEGRLDNFHAAAVRSGREGNSSSSSSSSSSWAGDRLPVGATSRQEDTRDAEDIRQIVLPLNALFVAALNWVLQAEVDRYHAAATRLLLSDRLWDKVRKLLDSEVLLQPEIELRSVWMFLARFRIKGHQGLFNALAAEICHMLGERRASRMIEAVVTGSADSASDFQRMMRAFGPSTVTAIFGVAKLRELQWKAILGEP